MIEFLPGTLYAAAVMEFGGQPSNLSLETLEKRYRVPPRAYHNFEHVRAVLKTARALVGAPLRRHPEVVLALMYHDVVYDSRAKDNEERSAELAREELGRLGIREEALGEIARLILLTKSHLVEDGDFAGAVVVDADLAILQSAPEEYDRYAAAIREEYAWVPDEEYRAGRTKVLEGLMARKLFRSPLLDEEAARANMRREIGWLESRDGGTP